MSIVPDVDTLWVNPAIGYMVLPFIVNDLSSYVPGQLDTMAAGSGGTGALLGGNNTADWTDDNPYHDGDNVQYVVMQTAATGGAIEGTYIRELHTPPDTVGQAWMSAGNANAYYTIIFNSACTDYNLHYTHC